MAKLWGGAFDKKTQPLVEQFTASMEVDSRLWEVDLKGSIAHVQMLARVGVLSAQEGETLVSGLHRVREGILVRKYVFNPNAEDVHSEIERFLGEEVGALSGKLHTARSRNDQVATDVRLYLREKVAELDRELERFQRELMAVAEKEVETLLPGYTHLQHAQPISLGHYLMAYFWMFARDRERLRDSLQRLNRSPLGSAALAGTSFPIDREWTARTLGFSAPTENSLDSVSDRDYVLEFLGVASTLMMHLSRISEEWILWSSPEFGFIRLDDSVTTGSSIMPQKKNPDVLELVRGKTGRVYGALIGAYTMMKALPLSYNRDLQEDKTYLFEGLDTVQSSLSLVRMVFQTASFQKDRMRSALRGDFSNATEIADALARDGMPFRIAHEVAGRVVKYSEMSGTAIEDLSVEELQSIDSSFSKYHLDQLTHASAVQARKSLGGTSPHAVRIQINQAKDFLLGFTSSA